jgi:hypothetical protein
MPLNSRDKRSSAVDLTLPWRATEPVADGALNQGDRQHTGLMYRGIAAASPTPVAAVAAGFWLMRARRRLIGDD